MEGNRRWKHKETGKEVCVRPYWEQYGGKAAQILNEEDMKKAMASMGEETDLRIIIGALVQVGWLFRNENDVWMVVSLDAAAQFEDLGEWTEEDKQQEEECQPEATT